jgi:hypothetical protein
MKKLHLDLMTRGWFVGDFEPTALRTQAAEVAVKKYLAGDHEACHHHKVAREVTLILQGTAQMNDCRYTAGDIVVIDPGEATDFTALTDVVTVVVKVPCVAGDKYPGEAAHA